MTLVSPGVEVTVTDDSFFIPAAAGTVPLFFVATASEKTTPDGSPALGTFESGVIRTVTSLEQSISLYGIPRFLEDSNGNPQHGDARNEYGLLALNKFLGVANRAYVVRADVNLNDDRDAVLDLWQTKISQSTNPIGAAYVLEGLVTSFITEYNITNALAPSDPGYKTTVEQSELLSLIDEALEEVLGEIVSGPDTFFGESTFRTIREDFTTDHAETPLTIYPNGFDQAPATSDIFGFAGGFLGITGMANAWVADGTLGSVAGSESEWSAVDARDFLIAAADDFQYTAEFLNGTTLGANDAARRVAVSEAFAAQINSNTDVRSERIEYTLIATPGYPEVVDEMVALSADIFEEALVIGDVPMNMSPSEIVAWADGSVLPWPRQRSANVAYYYPHDLTSNLDGKQVLGAASGIVLRTIASSDANSELWFAPAGTRRGLVTGSAAVGYITGNLGSATTFNQVLLNRGQRDDLYKYTTNINPIADMPDVGLVVYGQKTSAANASALDRVNVSRLVMYVRRQLRKNSLPYGFEFNDQLTRDSWKASADGFLADVQLKRGIFDFATVCDTSNNTPDRIDRNEMYLDVAIAPAKVAEFLYVPIRIVNTGEI